MSPPSCLERGEGRHIDVAAEQRVEPSGRKRFALRGVCSLAEANVDKASQQHPTIYQNDPPSIILGVSEVCMDM